LPAPDS